MEQGTQNLMIALFACSEEGLVGRSFLPASVSWCSTFLSIDSPVFWAYNNMIILCDPTFCRPFVEMEHLKNILTKVYIGGV